MKSVKSSINKIYERSYPREIREIVLEIFRIHSIYNDVNWVRMEIEAKLFAIEDNFITCTR